MAAYDWATLFDAVTAAIGDVITSIITALSDNADLIVSLLVASVVVGAMIKLGNKAFRGLRGMFRKIVS